MDQHPGASITLSFGLVFVFAIVLYQPDHPAQPGVLRAAPAAKHATPPVPETAPLPPLTASEPLPLRPVRAASVAAPGEETPLAGAEGPRPGAVAEHPESKRAITPRPRRSAKGPAPGDGFTQAAEGETLRDVALRIYGSAEEAEALWRLNRDLVLARDIPLAEGTLLRTP
jgi:hypothetical protein